MSERPADRKYTTDHEWVRQEGDEVVVGITDFAVEQLGDLVFVELPEVGASFEAGDSAAEVESVKAVSEVYCPVAGKITAVNGGLSDDQGPLSSDPFGEGWLFKVRVDGDLPGDLLDLAAYEAQLASEAGA